jgi:gentisate 1,2-dioxygenase
MPERIRFEPDAVREDVERWPALVVTREEIDAEIERLASLARPADGVRRSLVVHPRATRPGLGLAPGIRVALEVLLPGEETEPVRHNSTQIGFCIQGGGGLSIAGRELEFARYDVWNHPAWANYSYRNRTRALQARLTYSNAALLEQLGIHLVENRPPEAVPRAAEGAAADPRRKSPFGTFALGNDGAQLMPYETLINPPAVESRPLHWPWTDVEKHLLELESLGRDYVGRRLYLLHNPITGRTNGTTPSFFATMTIRPAGVVDRPHRHSSAAINYYFQGRGRSTVEGVILEWKAGDLMLSAPGWAVHNHASHDERVYELTVQDQPFGIATESLLWQEDLKHPPALLGTEAGFATNRARDAGSR